MENVFYELLNGRINATTEVNKPNKIISIVAENFSLLENQARFLKATFAIPSVLPSSRFRDSKLRLIQIGPLPQEIGDLVRKLKWAVNQYDNYGESICDRIEEDLLEVSSKSLIFINDLSRLELASADPLEAQKLLKLAFKLKHHVIFLYQLSEPKSTSTLLRDTELISDGCIRVRSCKAGYFKSMWWQPTHDGSKSLHIIPPKVQTAYYISKIGKAFFHDLLCFYENKEVSRNFELNEVTNVRLDADPDANEEGDHDKNPPHCRPKIQSLQEKTLLEKPPDEDDESTRPYIQAQNPEKSRIFYYPDKDDDIDEDDPDNDLNV